MNIEHAMSSGLLFIGFLYLFLITFIEIPLSATRYVDTILGFILGSALGSVINFWWGSSSGSSVKSDVISKQLEEVTEINKQNSDGESK